MHDILQRQQDLLRAMRAIVDGASDDTVAADAASITAALRSGNVAADVARTIAALAIDAALRDAFAHVMMVEMARWEEDT